MDKASPGSKAGKWRFCALPLLAASSKPGRSERNAIYLLTSVPLGNIVEPLGTQTATTRYSERMITVRRDTFRVRSHAGIHANPIRTTHIAGSAQPEGPPRLLRKADGGSVRPCQLAAMAQVLRGQRAAGNEPADVVSGDGTVESVGHGRTSIRLVSSGRRENRRRLGCTVWRAARRRTSERLCTSPLRGAR
jgi:hypothetical protein